LPVLHFQQKVFVVSHITATSLYFAMSIIAQVTEDVLHLYGYLSIFSEGQERLQYYDQFVVSECEDENALTVAMI
jgi:hypothetical protein